MKRYFWLLLLVLLSGVASASGLSVGEQATSQLTGLSPGQLIKNYYNFALMLGGLLAFGAIVYGAVRYMISAGNPSGQTDARDQITQALIGLVLLLGIFTLLNFINPELTHLNLPSMSEMGQVRNVSTPNSWVASCQQADVQRCTSQNKVCSMRNGTPTCTDLTSAAAPQGECNEQDTQNCVNQSKHCSLNAQGTAVCTDNAPVSQASTTVSSGCTATQRNPEGGTISGFFCYPNNSCQGALSSCSACQVFQNNNCGGRRTGWNY